MKEHANHWLSILEACLLVALGVQMINAAGLLVGGTAGLGLIAQQMLPNLSFGQLFFVINLPFYVVAIRYMGTTFTLRTFGAVTLLSLLSDLIENTISLQLAHPLVASILGGLLIGFGLTILIRHNASIGGITIMAVFLERRMNINAAKTTLCTDVSILLLGLIFFDLTTVAYSLVAFVAVSSVLGRYRQPKMVLPTVVLNPNVVAAKG